MKRRIPVLLGIVFLLLLTTRPGTAYPISPVTLWGLVEDADLVLIGRVLENETIETDDYDWTNTVATIRVGEVLKGEPVDEVQVRYAAGLVCPAPARYIAGETVVAFLRHRDGEWFTVALSYGTRYPEPTEIEDYRTVIRLAAKLQKNRRDAYPTASWMTEAASRVATRWDGLYLLSPAGDGLHSYYDQTDPQDQGWRLTSAHRKKIAATFVSHPPENYLFTMSLQVLRPLKDADVDRTAVGILEGYMEADQPSWWLKDAMVEVFKRFGDRRPKKRARKLGDEFDPPEPAVARAVWKQAKLDLAIPDVAPIYPDRPRVRGVGGTTPD